MEEIKAKHNRIIWGSLGPLTTGHSVYYTKCLTCRYHSFTKRLRVWGGGGGWGVGGGAGKVRDKEEFKILQARYYIMLMSY